MFGISSLRPDNKYLRLIFLILVAGMLATWSHTPAYAAEPRIAFFRVVPIVEDGRRWYEFHWQVLGADRVRLFEDKREVPSRIQLRDGRFGWPDAMSGSFRQTLSRTARFTLLAEGSRGARIAESVVVDVRPARTDTSPPRDAAPQPRILTFAPASSRVRTGATVRFAYSVRGADHVRLYRDGRQVTRRDTARRGAGGSFSVRVGRTSTFRLVAAAGPNWDEKMVTVVVMQRPSPRPTSPRPTPPRPQRSDGCEGLPPAQQAKCGG